MGAIDSKELDGHSNEFSDRKEIIGNTKGNTSSTDVKLNDSSEANKCSNDEPKDVTNDKSHKKTKTYDFVCTVFYGMVALLFFSTMTRTYSHYSGHGCGPLFGAQSLLAYCCVGMACAIIRSLRKHIKEQNRDTKNGENEENNEKSTESNPYEIQTNENKMNTDINSNESKNGLFPVITENDFTVVEIPYGQHIPDKLSTGLPLPSLPPPNSLIRRQDKQKDNEKNVEKESNKKELNTLAVDLKAAETELEKQKNKFNEIKCSESLPTTEWKDIKFETELFRNTHNSHKPIEHNWNNYNLNTIDKY